MIHLYDKWIRMVNLHRTIDIGKRVFVERPIALVAEYSDATTVFLIDGIPRIH